jgi:O-antigen/teichoic acid export membrane protein
MIDTTAQNTIKNAGYNFAGFLFPIVVLVVFTPIIIRHLGVEVYGIYVFLNTVMAFLSLLDIGVGTATNKNLIEHLSHGSNDKAKSLLYSMNTAYVLHAGAYLILCVIIGIILQLFFQAETPQPYFLIMIIVGITGGISWIFANFLNTMIALQRYDIHIKISSFFLMLSNISILVLAIMGYGLVFIFVAQLLISVLSFLAYYFYIRKIFPMLCFKYEWDISELKSNYRYAISLSVNNIASSSLVHLDKLIIPMFLGSSALTYYSVPGSVATKISSLSNTFSSLLFPITVNLHALNNQEKIRRVYIRSIRVIGILSVAISLSVIFLADKILLYWLDDVFAKESTTVLIFLVLTNLVLALLSPLTNLLSAMNKLSFLAKGSIVMLIINIVGLFILLPKFGINGASIAYFLAVLWVFVLLFYAEKKYLLVNHRRQHLLLVLKIIITTVPFYFIINFAVYPLITDIYTLALACLVGPPLFLFIYKIFGFVEQEDWNDIIIFYRRCLLKLK